MSINTSTQLASVESAVQYLQETISAEETNMASLIEGSSTFLEDMARIRTSLTQLRALLGNENVSRSFWLQEVNEERNSRKSDNELAKA